MSDFLEAVGFGVLNDFLSMYHSNHGYQTGNRWEVLIRPPVTIGGSSLSNVFTGKTRSSGNSLKDICLNIQSVTLPGQNITTTEDTNIYGPSRKVGDGITFAEEITLELLTTTDLRERQYFVNWMNLIVNPANWNIGYYADYIGELDIYLLDKNDQKKYAIRLKEAYPSVVGPANLDNAPKTEVMKTSVNFRFRYIEPLGINEQPPSLGSKITETIVNAVERKIQANVPKVLNKLF